MTIWRMRIACKMPQAIYARAQRERERERERMAVIRHIYCNNDCRNAPMLRCTYIVCPSVVRPVRDVRVKLFTDDRKLNTITFVVTNVCTEFNMAKYCILKSTFLKVSTSVYLCSMSAVASHFLPVTNFLRYGVMLSCKLCIVGFDRFT